MKFDIFKNDKKINCIVADKEFCEKYCYKNGYTYELVKPETVVSEENLEVSSTEQLRADIDYLALMSGVNL